MHEMNVEPIQPLVQDSKNNLDKKEQNECRNHWFQAQGKLSAEKLGYRAWDELLARYPLVKGEGIVCLSPNAPPRRDGQFVNPKNEVLIFVQLTG